MTWACLALTAVAAPPSDIIPMNQRGFTIPVDIRPERRAEIKELLLFVSTDEGQGWTLFQKAPPEQTSFQFVAEKDGLYFFNIAIRNQKDQQEPASFAGVVPQKILVDTTPPSVKLTAERQGDEVAATWDIVEANPEASTLRLEYRTADAPPEQWTVVPITPGPKGKTSIKPAPATALAVRLQLTDQAGNVGKDEVAVPAAGGLRNQPMIGEPLPKIPTGDDKPPPPRDVPRWDYSQGGAARTDVLPPVASSAGASGPGSAVQPVRNEVPPVMPSTLTTVLPPVQIINRRQVKLDFEVTRFGPSGLGSVDVYVTMDDGKSWAKSPTEGNVTLPMATEIKPGQPLRGSVTVQLNKEEPVVYGFYMVVKSRANLGKPPPRPGDPPQLRVEVDMTPPYAELMAPTPDHDSRDGLVLTWKASDLHMADNPISLEWAPSKDGPWSFIGSPQLPNTGKYIWHLPASVPPSVYLKLTARDVAGNSAVAETSEPVLVDLTIPEVGPPTISLAPNR
jgi:hypothetical protein